MTRLLRKPLLFFISYTLLVFACSVPVCYGIIRYIWNTQLDKHNQLTADFTRRKLEHSKLNEPDLKQMVHMWNNLNPGSLIVPYYTSTFPKDSVFNMTRTYKLAGKEHKVPYRSLITYLLIHDNPYQLTIETQSGEFRVASRLFITATLLFFLLLTGGFILINRSVSARIWKPFKAMLARIKDHELSSEERLVVTPENILEFAELEAALTSMVDRHIATYSAQKKLTEKVSHILEAPLELTQAKLDQLLQLEEVSKSQKQHLLELNTALSSISKINKDLLVLAKFDNKKFGSTGTVNLSREVESMLSLLSEYHHEKGIKVKANIEKGVSLQMNKALAEILVQHLISNASLHSPRSAELSITLNPRTFEVVNTAVKPLNKDKLFKPFSKGPDSDGAGLGLAIVRQICQLYGWQVYYQFREGRHHFVLSFK
ncbi:Signal transduction histidine kinase [bacterium A37T11]|nr:Signal transduction histidine kinase [bacterium A37T11]